MIFWIQCVIMLYYSHGVDIIELYSDSALNRSFSMISWPPFWENIHISTFNFFMARGRTTSSVSLLMYNLLCGQFFLLLLSLRGVVAASVAAFK